MGGFQILPETGIGWPGCSGNHRHLTFAIRALMNAHAAGRLSGLCFRPLRSGLESKCRHERLLREIFRYPRDVCGPMFNTGQPHAMRNSAHRLCASAGSEGGFGVSMRGRFPEPLSFGELGVRQAGVVDRAGIYRAGDQCGRHGGHQQRHQEAAIAAGQFDHQNHGRYRTLGGSGQNRTGPHQREQARGEQKFLDDLAGRRGSSIFAWKPEESPL